MGHRESLWVLRGAMFLLGAIAGVCLNECLDRLFLPGSWAEKLMVLGVGFMLFGGRVWSKSN